MSNLMIDIETLSTLPDATILTIAAQAFDPFGHGHHPTRFYYARLNLDSQSNRSIEEDTVQWWANQDQRTKDEAFAEEGRVDMATALAELHKLAWHADLIWCNGVGFDIFILENAMAEVGLNPPWKYYKTRDTRTVYGLVPELKRPPVTHHALDDCRQQILMLQECLDRLNVRSFR